MFYGQVMPESVGEFERFESLFLMWAAFETVPSCYFAVPLTRFHSRWDACPAPQPDSAQPRSLWRRTLRGGRSETAKRPAHPRALPQLPG